MGSGVRERVRGDGELEPCDRAVSTRDSGVDGGKGRTAEGSQVLRRDLSSKARKVDPVARGVVGLSCELDAGGLAREGEAFAALPVLGAEEGRPEHELEDVADHRDEQAGRKKKRDDPCWALSRI